MMKECPVRTPTPRRFTVIRGGSKRSPDPEKLSAKELTVMAAELEGILWDEIGVGWQGEQAVDFSGDPGQGFENALVELISEAANCLRLVQRTRREGAS